MGVCTASLIVGVGADFRPGRASRRSCVLGVLQNPRSTRTTVVTRFSVEDDAGYGSGSLKLTPTYSEPPTPA